MPRPSSAKAKDVEVVRDGDGTADDVIRANISYVSGAESVQIQIKCVDEVKGYHIKSIEVEADQVAEVLGKFLSKLDKGYSPTGSYMESAESYATKKEGRAGSNAYNGATGVSVTDENYNIKLKLQEARANGESVEVLAELEAKWNEINESEVNRINEMKKDTV